MNIFKTSILFIFISFNVFANGGTAYIIMNKKFENHLECKKLETNNSKNFYTRCENKEVICYETGEGNVSCKFK